VQNPHDKVERSLLKMIGWTVAVIVVLSVGGVFGYGSYRAWQQRRLVAQGNAFANEGDFKRAGLNARRILQLNADSPDAYRLLARIAEKTGSPSATDWRRRVMDLGLANVEDLILLARDAVRYDDRVTADVAISKLPADAQNRADYHALLAEIAYAERDGAEMERQLSEALRLDPTNKEYIMRQAALRLSANDIGVSEGGRQTLLELQKDPAFRREATRHLADSALRLKDYTSAVALGRELDSMPDRTFKDRLTLLSALKGASDPGYAQFLAELESAAAEDPDAAAALITWMNINQMSQDAIAWSAKLPPKTLSSRLVSVALSDAYVAARDWAGLQRMVKGSNWGTIDFLRSALWARALRELGSQPESVVQWRDAVKKVTGNTRQILLLADTVEKWNWRGEAIELLWLAANDPVKGDDALRTLYNYFAKNADTQNLYRVLLHQNERHPDDLNFKNNLAQLSLLLSLNRDRGRELAREVYAKDPHNPAYVSTYAFSLFANGDVQKARQAMEGLTDAQRHQPEIAAYYGVILAATGDHARAVEFLDLGELATLLPEEKALVQKARRSLAQG
jgi:cytochrome c-type biogenesis protein CcmH/NrfG